MDLIGRQLITRKGTFDAGHRVMNERMKCFNLHGHTYHYELIFSFKDTEDIGYAIDFKEIKRVACQWIDDNMDHGTILNPMDSDLIDLCLKNQWKVWIMSLRGSEYCNPTVENIAKEILLAVEILVSKDNLGLKLYEVKLYETPNCLTSCFAHSVTSTERTAFRDKNKKDLLEYLELVGSVEYDDRKS